MRQPSVAFRLARRHLGILGNMPSLVQKLSAFLNSPQGRRIVSEGRRQLAKPENQNKLRALLARFRGGGRRGRY